MKLAYWRQSYQGIGFRLGHYFRITGYNPKLLPKSTRRPEPTAVVQLDAAAATPLLLRCSYMPSLLISLLLQMRVVFFLCGEVPSVAVTFYKRNPWQSCILPYIAHA